MWCGYNMEHDVECEIDWHEWKCHLEKITPYHLEMSGGEPLLYNGIVDLIKNINTASTWAITSNTLLYDPALDLSRCKHWTASWHGYKKEQFIENVVAIDDRGCPLSVSIVVEFANVDKWLQDAYDFRNLGLQVNLLRELNKNVDWNGTKEWQKVVEMRRYGFNVVEDDIPASYTFQRGFMCGGGADYLCAMPDGQAFRCYSEAMLGEPIGHIGEVELQGKEYECKSKCLACALDYKFRGKKLQEGEVA